MMNAQPKPNLAAPRGFEPNAFYERIIALRESSPAAFDSLAPVTKLALGQYEAQKREAARLQAVRNEPAASQRRGHNI